MKTFKIYSFTNWDKDICVTSEELTLKVDYDDVDHKTVKKAMKKMVKILNKHWNDSEE